MLFPCAIWSILCEAQHIYLNSRKREPHNIVLLQGQEEVGTGSVGCTVLAQQHLFLELIVLTTHKESPVVILKWPELCI